MSYNLAEVENLLKKNQEIHNLLNNSSIKNIKRIIRDRFCDSRSTGLIGAAVALQNCSAIGIEFSGSNIKN
jgi:hypothetical protein